MSEQNTQTTTPAQDPGAQTTAQPAATPPQAATVDTASIVTQAEQKAMEAAEKKMTGVFKSMLEQHGLDAETINKMTTEWKSKQQTPEQAMKDLQGQLSSQVAENEALNRQIAAIGKGIAADKAPRYIKLAESYMTDGVEFDAALDAALVDFPVEAKTEPPPAYAAGTGTNKMLGTNKDISEMGYLERVAFKKSNPALYEQMTKQEE